MRVDEFKDPAALKTALVGSTLLWLAVQHATNRYKLHRARMALDKFHRIHFPDQHRRKYARRKRS